MYYRIVGNSGKWRMMSSDNAGVCKMFNDETNVLGSFHESRVRPISEEPVKANVEEIKKSENLGVDKIDAKVSDVKVSFNKAFDEKPKRATTGRKRGRKPKKQ